MDDCEWTDSDDSAFNLRLVQEYKAAKEMADTSKKRADGLKSQQFLHIESLYHYIIII